MTSTISNLEKTTEKSKKRIGRGHGSGRGGHTSTRGSKGQKSRTSMDVFFEGTKLKKSLVKKLPLYRGKGKLKSRQAPVFIINLKYLNVFKEGEEVSLVTLQEKGVLDKNLGSSPRIKILGNGELSKSLKINLPCSKSAAEKVKKAGGSVIYQENKKVKQEITPPVIKIEKKKIIKKTDKKISENKE